MTTRRRFLALAGLAAIARAPSSSAQGGSLRRIGLLVPRAATPDAEFRKRLAKLGWIEGKNLAIELRAAENQLGRFAILARELVERKVELIVVSTTPGAQAAKQASASIPIVFAHVSDPEDAGLVASLAKPGGNVTGVAIRAIEIAPKQVELLKALAPGAQRLASLRHPPMGAAAMKRMDAQIDAAAARAGLQLMHFDASGPDDLGPAFVAAARERATTMIVTPAPLFFQQAKRIGTLALEHRLATVSASRVFVEAGGLASYGLDYTDAFARTARYVDAILRGAKAAELAVEETDRFEIVVNRATARALGLKVPQLVLLQATEVIE